KSFPDDVRRHLGDAANLTQIADIGRKRPDLALHWPYFSYLVSHNRILAAPPVARRQAVFDSDHPKTGLVTRAQRVRSRIGNHQTDFDFRLTTRRQTMQKGTV